MESIIDRLKNRASSDLPGTEDIFEILAAACSYCCKTHTGGNESCPPKTELSQEV